MSKLDELIQEICPEGVEYMQLGAIEDAGLIKLGRGNVISKKDIAAEPGDYPIYSSSASGVGEFGRYGKYMFDDERLSWSVDGGGRFFYRHPHKYSLTNVSGWLKVLDSSRIDIKYLFYALDSAWSTKKFDYTKKAHPSVIRNEYKIPVPPLEVQKEIANILDKFTQLEAELSAELSAELVSRRKQYEYYRNQLLTIGDGEGVRRTTLGEIGVFTRGNGPQKKDFTDNGIGCIHYGQIYTHYGTFTDKTKIFVSEEVAKRSKKARPGNLVIATTSENDEDVCKAVAWLGDDEIAISNHTAIFAHNENPKYMAYLFQTQDFFKQKKRYIKGTKVKDVSANSIAKFDVSLPLRDEQDRIVDILDNFDALTSSISEGLPAEITARRKQYEYYRTKLLTFQELSA